MTPSAELAALRARHNQMGKLLDECELLEQCFHSGDLAAVVGWEDALRQEFKRRIIETPFASVRDIIPAMIAERVQALADLGLGEPGALRAVWHKSVRVKRLAESGELVHDAFPGEHEIVPIPAILNHESP